MISINKSSNILQEKFNKLDNLMKSLEFNIDTIKYYYTHKIDIFNYDDIFTCYIILTYSKHDDIIETTETIETNICFNNIFDKLYVDKIFTELQKLVSINYPNITIHIL